MEAASAQTTSHGITQKRSASGQVLDVLPVPKLDPGEAALTARHWHLTDTCCHCNVTTITTLPGRGTRSAAHRAAQSFPLPEYADWYLRLARAKVAKQFHTVIFVWHLRATYAHLLSHTIRVRCYHVSASAMASVSRRCLASKGGDSQCFEEVVKNQTPKTSTRPHASVDTASCQRPLGPACPRADVQVPTY